MNSLCRTLFGALCAIFLLPNLAAAQVLSSSQHVLPWVVDGRPAPPGGLYRTEIVISNPNFSFANCSLQLGGLAARFETLNGSTAGPVFTLNFSVFPAGYEVLRTTGAQPL